MKEIDDLKELLGNGTFYKELSLNDWEVTQAIPPSDLVWPNISKVAEQSRWHQIYYLLKPILLASLSTVLLLMVETYSRISMSGIGCSIVMYLTLNTYIFYNFYITPLVIFNGITREEHVKKSDREAAYNYRLIATLLVNMLVVPIVYSMTINSLYPKLFRENG